MRVSILALSLLLSACSMTPDFVKPAAPIPATFGDQIAQENLHSAASIGWRSMFGDPRLQKLIVLALENNRDLRLASINVQAVQAQYRIQRAEQLPKIGLTGAATRQRAADPLGGSSPIVQNQVSLNVGIAAFELDLWGRTRAMTEAALSRYLASEEGRQAAQISLVAAVADAYYAQRLAEAQLELAEQTLQTWTVQRDLAQQLKDAKQYSALDIAQDEGQVARALADKEAFTRSLALASNALQLVVGADLAQESLPAPLAMDDAAVLTQLPAGLPSAMLIYRPDIRQAEQTLRAANADIGAARAAFFPQISLTASAGFASTAVGGLFSGQNKVWSFGPQITQPIFQAGRLSAELDLAKLRKSSAVAEYEKTIQVAFREVADGLAGSATYFRQIAAQTEVVNQESRRAVLAAQLRAAGLSGRLELLDAERQKYAAQQELISLKYREISNAISLYKSLGGGLAQADEPPAQNS